MSPQLFRRCFSHALSTSWRHGNKQIRCWGILGKRTVAISRLAGLEKRMLLVLSLYLREAILDSSTSHLIFIYPPMSLIRYTHVPMENLYSQPWHFLFDVLVFFATDMAHFSPLPVALAVLLYLACCFTAVLAQNETETLPTFGDTVKILGAVSNSYPSLRLPIDNLRWKERTKTSRMA